MTDTDEKKKMSTTKKMALGVALVGVGSIVGVSIAYGAGAFKKDDSLMTPEDYKFMDHVSKYGKSYASRAEYDMRAKIYKQNLIKIDEHNKKGHKHMFGENALMDQTPEEFQSMLGFVGTVSSGSTQSLSTDILLSEVDWRTSGKVSPVKN